MIDTVVIQPGADTREPAVAGISWASIAAGAIVACALTFVLLAFGVGLGNAVILDWRIHRRSPPNALDRRPQR
jgi:hypothetical protein